MEENSVYRLWGTSSDLEVNGFTLDYGNGIKFELARAGGRNTLYDKKLKEHAMKYKRSSKLGLDPKTSRKIAILTFVDAVLKNWSGVTHKDSSEAIEYTREHAINLFYDLPDLFNDLCLEAVKIQNFQEEVIEAEKK